MASAWGRALRNFFSVDMVRGAFKSSIEPHRLPASARARRGVALEPGRTMPSLTDACGCRQLVDPQRYNGTGEASDQDAGSRYGDQVN